MEVFPHGVPGYCDLGPVARCSPAPTPGASDMLHRVQAYRGNPVQQLGFCTASTTLLPPDRMRRRVEAADLHWPHLPPWLRNDPAKAPTNCKQKLPQPG
ncbi:hypothetical protein ElyMa_001854700 [Elysia marginata]|uniref:Uncharacterized protein n=1 Tax=Elysia marginata TaxID=1093978 RepID=A0AAV4ENB1_9GAST|nr:hypothetical protein ElyMa_001854700 [Elysia marginata]